MEIYLKISLLLVLVCALNGASAQGTQAELLRRISQSVPDTNRVDLLLQAGCYHLLKPGNRKTDLDSAFSFFDPAVVLSRKLGSDKWVNESLKWKGDCYLEGEQLVQGEACFREVIDYYHRKGDKRNESATWSRLGDCIPMDDDELAAEKLRVFSIAEGLAHELHDTLRDANLLRMMGSVCIGSHRFDSAERYILAAVREYKSVHFPGMHRAYYSLIDVYQHKNDLRTAVYYNGLMIKSIEDAHDSAMAIPFYQKAGATYYYTRMYDESLRCYLKDWETFGWPAAKRWDGYGFQVITAYCIVKLLLLKDSAAKGLQFLQDAAKKFPPTTIISRLVNVHSFAMVYQALGDMRRAGAAFDLLAKGLDSTESAAREGTATASEADEYHFEGVTDIGEFYVNNGQFRKADEFIRKQPKDFEIGKDADNRLHYELLRSRIDSSLGRYGEALRHFSIYKRLSDSMFSVDAKWQMQELQVKTDVAQKDNDLQLQGAHIELLNKQNKLQQSEAERAGLFRKMMIGGIVLLVLLVGVIWNRVRLKQRTNARLQKLLVENEWLMREIHHRVKNNLQVVMSLLNSQTAYMKDPVAISAVMESRHRVQAMSLIHQKLYKSAEVSSVDMVEYIGELVDYLRDSFDVERCIGFDLQVASVTLDVSQAVPLGLILNEAITNSYKYAFPGAAPAKITLRLCVEDGRMIRLYIADNGRGMPAAARFETNDHFGLSLIRGLAGDLDAELQIDGMCGTAYRLSFKALLLI